MALKKRDLENLWEFQSRGLSQSVKNSILQSTGRGGVSKAADYISACCLLAEYGKLEGVKSLDQIQSKDEIINALHPATRFRWKAYTPCLAERIDSLKESEQKSLFDNRNWVFSRKENGVRAWVIVYNGDVHVYSRNYSDVDCSLLEYKNNIDQQVNPEFKGIYAVDCELKFEPGVDISKDLEELGIATDSPLEAMTALLHTYPHDAVAIQTKFREKFGKELITFRLIAPLYFNGKNYLKRTLGEGIDVYQDCVDFGQSLGLNIKAIPQCSGSREEKQIFLNTIIEQNGEGVVCWNRNGYYITSENRSKTSFIKIKRKIGDTLGLGDTFDGFIGGFSPGSVGTANEGIIGALNFYIYINDNGRVRKHWVAAVPNISREERIFATWNNADGLYPQEWIDSKGESHWMSLNPEMDGLVGELTGQALSSKSIRLEHPSLVRWRTERSPESCIYAQEFINSQTTASAFNNGKVSYK